MYVCKDCGGAVTVEPIEQRLGTHDYRVWCERCQAERGTSDLSSRRV